MQLQKEMIYYLLGVVICLVVIHVLVYHNARARMISKLPGPNRYFVVRNAWKCIRSPVELMKMARYVANIYDGIYCVWIYPFVAVFIYNPDDIEKIMSNIKYADKGFIYNFLKPWLRDGLLLSSGAKWQERRKILTPTFHFSILKQFFEVIEDNSNDFVHNLKEAAGKPVDVSPIISEFTLNSICETAMGTQLTRHTTKEAISYKQAIYNMGLLFVTRFTIIFLYFDTIYNLSPWGRKQKDILKVVHNFTETVIEQRKDYMEKYGINIDTINDDDVFKKRKKTAMLDLLILAEKDRLINKIGVQEEVDTFMFEVSHQF